MRGETKNQAYVRGFAAGFEIGSGLVLVLAALAWVVWKFWPL